MSLFQAVLANRYRLLEPVGSGGMGRVWLARDEVLRRDVAIKQVIPPGWLTDEEREELNRRTLREARTAAALSHPHVVQIYDVVYAGEQPWIVMEYVRSRSLHQVVADDGPLSPPEVAQVGLCVLAALTAAHAAGVLHRDVKPHNVLIGEDGRVVLTDFGLATFDDSDGETTRQGLIHGSPQYVAPERAQDGSSTAESDLWSLGATLYAAVEGRSPYARANPMATLVALATKPPDPTRRAGALKPVLIGLLRKNPSARLRPAEVEARLLKVAGTGSPGKAGLRLQPVQPAQLLRPRPLAGPPDAAPLAIEPAEVPGPGLHGGQTGESSDERVPAVPGQLMRALGLDADADPDADESPTTKLAPAEPATEVIALAPPRRRNRRPGLVAALVAVVALGAGALFATDLRGAFRSEAAVSAAPTSSAPGPGGASAGMPAPAVSGFSARACEADPPADAAVTPVDTGAAPGRAGYALPKDWTMHRDPAGFAVAVPDGWRVFRSGSTLCFRDPYSVRVISVDAGRDASADPVAACRKERDRLLGAGALPGYAEESLGESSYFSAAADWVFSYDGTGTGTMKSAVRWFKTTEGRAYALGWSVRQFDWQTQTGNLQMIYGSFEP